MISVINADNPLLMLDVNDCTTFVELANTLKENPTKIGFGNAGSMESTNFKTLVGNPGDVGNYAGCFCRLLGYGNELIIIHIIASGLGNQIKKCKEKYVWINGNQRTNISQSAWTEITAQA